MNSSSPWAPRRSCTPAAARADPRRPRTSQHIALQEFGLLLGITQARTALRERRTPRA
ncbi:hypothetical protein ABZS99_48370 [Streptomyces sp. NPDC005463]|uniref:hypothetical protein n=1 Tax=Streptomyces sp. NPDC005463 TaxID=3154465 RepID=UPI0033A32FC7